MHKMPYNPWICNVKYNYRATRSLSILLLRLSSDLSRASSSRLDTVSFSLYAENIVLGKLLQTYFQ